MEPNIVIFRSTEDLTEGPEKDYTQSTPSESTNNNKDWLKPFFSVSRVIPVRPTDLAKKENTGTNSSAEKQYPSDVLTKKFRAYRTEESDRGTTNPSSESNQRKDSETRTISIVYGGKTSPKLKRQTEVQEKIDSPSIQFTLNTEKSDNSYSVQNNNTGECKLLDENREISNGFLPVDNTDYLSSHHRDEKREHQTDKKDSIADYGILGSETVSPVASSRERKHRKFSLDARMSFKRRDSSDGNMTYAAGSPKTDKNSPSQSPGRSGRKQFGPGSYSSSVTSALSGKRRDSKDGALKRMDSKGEISPMSLRMRRRANSMDPAWQLRTAQEIRARSPTVPDLKSEEAQLADEQKRRTGSVDRIMRDYRLSRREVKALRCILGKVNLYDDDVRNTLKPVLSGSTPTISEDGEEDDVEKLSDAVIKDAEKESLKQKLFMSRKELDSYISFTRKMEKEKKQTNSEKEELRTRVQWLEKRLTLMESESKALKIERAEFLNQIYRLRCPANVPVSERGNLGRGSVMSSDSSEEVEVSKQRLKYEADAFATERAKMIKERQRLDEEVRKVQIRCVSLLAQLQHAEKTIDDLQVEKEALKSKLDKSSQQLNDDTRSLQDQLNQFETLLLSGRSDKGFSNVEDIEKKLVSLFDFVKETQGTKAELETQSLTLEDQLEECRREIRELREEKLTLDTETMALRKDLECVTNARNEAELKLSESDSNKLLTTSENKSLTESVARYKDERVRLASEIDRLSDTLLKTEQEKVSMEADRNVFENFLEMLSIELEEKLGEDHVTKDAEAGTLKEKAEVVGRQIRAHLAPARKLQDDYDDIKEELDDLRKENDALKYAMSCRVQIASFQQQAPPCKCSHEKELLERELDEMSGKLEAVESEVARLHQDKQSLLMSLMNLQAAARSREPSNVDRSDDGSETDDEEDEESTESEEEERDQVSPLAGRPAKIIAPGTEVKLTLKYDDVSSDADRTHSDEEVTQKPRVGKTLSLPVALARPSKSAEDIHEYTQNDNLVQDLDKQLKEMTKTKEKLEEERAGMLEALVSQVEQVEDLKAEVERLQQELEDNQQDDSFSSQGKGCPQCSKTSTEMRQYLKIIEELTEDKLRLEKLLGDVQRDKEKLIHNLEEETDVKFRLQKKVEQAAKERDDALNTAREEVDYLMQSLDNLQQDNASLEEHLQKIRRDRDELLNTLKAAEEDKLRLVQSLQMLSEQQGDSSATDIRNGRRGSFGTTALKDSSFEEEVTMTATRSKESVFNMLNVPRDEIDADLPSTEELDISHLVSKVKELEDSVLRYKETNTELTETVETLRGLLAEGNKHKEEEKQQGNSLRQMKPVKTQNEEQYTSRHNTFLKIRNGPVETEKGTGHLKRPEVKGSDVESKTLCFQISFNGIALADTGKISMFQ